MKTLQELRREQSKRFYAKHRVEILERMKNNPDVVRRQKAYVAKYLKTDKGKATRKRYMAKRAQREKQSEAPSVAVG